MNIDFEAIKNNEILVFITKQEESIKDSISYTLGNYILLNNSINSKEDEKIVKFINESKAKQIIFFNSLNRYRYIVPNIDQKKKIK
jgi:hypothetical protein